MSAAAIAAQDQRHWTIAGLVAMSAHVGMAGLVLAWSRPAVPPVPEPVVLVELPPQAAGAPAAAAQQAAALPQPAIAPQQPDMPPIDIPPVRAPLPGNPVTLPPQPVRAAAPAAAAAAAPVSAVAVAPTGTGPGASVAPGNDPRAKRQEADYFSLVSAHLNRRKVYPAAARQARQQGVVTVRFTVDRNGGVSGISIKRGSGHELLDNATLELLHRVAPLPRMPSAMQRDSVTLSLPIDYSLRTS